jgi:A/G-specific adenine glycosylase
MTAQISAFQQTVWDYYRAQGRRDLPWRQPEADGTLDPYKVLVSELMLQQTQVPRVIPKFEQFIRQFPSFESLAAAPLRAVLQAWSGLGYNRRAKFLWQTAREVVAVHNGQLPHTSAELITLPGIGPNTAGALLVYAFNQPVVFIETNIRTVFIHHFFAGQQDVHDRDIADLVARTLPDNAREWYWALMDYGTYLKQTVGNLNVLSKHYTKQSAFHGSRRQIRGQVLKLLGQKRQSKRALAGVIADERLAGVLDDLLHEGLVRQAGAYYKLPEE